MAMAAGRHAEARCLFECSPEGELFTAWRELESAATGTDPDGGARERYEKAHAVLQAHLSALIDYMQHWGMQCQSRRASPCRMTPTHS